MTEPIGDDDMHPPYGRWNELYHRASSVIRHGGGFPQDFIEDLVALGVPLNFKQLLMFNVCSPFCTTQDSKQHIRHKRGIHPPEQKYNQALFNSLKG